MTSPVASRPVAESMPIAIVGMGCRFPGGIVDAASFWELLCSGTDAISEIPADRFDIAQFFDARPATPGRVMSRYGGFLGPVDRFDAAFFGLSAAQAERLDPQQRVLLEVSWEALEDAGLDIANLASTPTGVFIGQWVGDFENRLFADPRAIDFPMTLGSGRYAAAGRISYTFGFRGPSLTVDAACSSGLAAVHLAVRSLRAGDGDIAIAGGVNLILQPHIHIAYSQSRMMAHDGRCKFGDAAGDGYVRAEGAGVVVLMPLAKAQAEQHRIYAVIRGSAVNNDGDSSGAMGRPSAIGQIELLRKAYGDAGVSPGCVHYMEAHGTGTRAGDPVELGALATVLSEGRDVGDRVWVGSVKTNIGHAEAAAGIAGLIKAALSLHRGAVPPSLHLTTLNPAIDWNAVPLAIPTMLTPWPAGSGPRYAGVNSFGIGGTNAHVVLESGPSMPGIARWAADLPAVVLPISARHPVALRQLARDYIGWIDAHPDVPVSALCATVANRRTALSHRVAFAVADVADLRAALDACAAGEGPETTVVHQRPRIAFVAPGQGGQWSGMARDMVLCVPVFRTALEECDRAARRFVDWSILEQLQLEPGASGYIGDRIDVIQPTLVALATAYARWVRSLGVEPDAVVGHSLGEIAAAAIAGALTLEDAMRIVCTRSQLMRRLSGCGAMAHVGLGPADLQGRLEGHGGEVTVAVSNSASSSVVAGEPDAVRALVADLEREGIFARMLRVDVASHSAHMEPLAVELTASLTGLEAKDAPVHFYSTVHGARVDGVTLDAAYWGRNLRQPVRFGDAVASLLADDVTVFVELGPHPVLVQAIEENGRAAAVAVRACACGRRDESVAVSAARTAAMLWTAGAPIDWRRVMPVAAEPLSLPHYPWQRERHWIDGLTAASLDGATHRRPSLGGAVRQWLYTLRWQDAPLSPTSDEAPRRPWLIVGRHGAAELRAALMARGHVVMAADSVGDATGWVTSAPPGHLRDLGIVVLIDADVSTAACDAVETLVALQRAWRARESQTTPRIWWVTRGAQMVDGRPQFTVDVAAAAVWGAARVMATEHPDWWGGLADIGSDVKRDAEWVMLARHLTARLPDRREDQVAIRGDRRYALRLTAADAAAGNGGPPWRADAAYLITGGHGGLAQEVATAMVRDGARRLVLLGRTALPPRAAWASWDEASELGQRIAAVRALEHAGASVHLLQADVSCEEDVRVALDAYRADGWPPIRGVVHMAASMDNRLTEDMDRRAFQRVLGPKLEGARILDRMFPDAEVFVLFSSLSASWGPTGLANYAAANAGLDALALARRCRGRQAVSIQWAGWANRGLHRSITATRADDEMHRAGGRLIPADVGTSLFSALTGSPEPVVAVLPIDWSLFRRARHGRDWPLFRDTPGGGIAAAEEGTAVARVCAAAPGRRRALLDAHVRETLASVLRLGTAVTDGQRPFGTMGLDSLTAVQLRNRLETVIERPLPATLAWNYPTVDQLVAHLESLCAQEALGLPSSPERPALGRDDAQAGHALDELASVSDEDAMRALRGED